MGASILLQTKFLIPHPSLTHLSRQGLVKQICDPIDKQRVLLIAPAGYGKTSLLTEVAEKFPHPLTWIQLDDGDNDPATFMSYLFEGLRRQLSGLMLPQISEESIPPERLLVILINSLLEQRDTAWMLILDDYHVIHNPIVHQLMTTLLENLPPQMRVVIASRITPVLPLARWRVQNHLIELRAEDLRFSTHDTQIWLKQLSYDLSELQVTQLVEKTEGWCAGLHLATTLLNEDKDNHDAVIAQFTGTQPYIFDYMMEEVFAQQTQDVQTFLLQSSVFGELNAETCASVLGIDSAYQILTQLEKNNLFISRLDKHKKWYRYHQLFRDFLLSKFKLEHATHYIKTQSNAGAYFAKLGQSEQAIQHFNLAGDDAQAIQQLYQFADKYLTQGRVSEVQVHLNSLSTDMIQSRPRLMIIQGRILRHNGQFGMATQHFDNAIAVSDDTLIICQAYTELAIIHHSQGQYQQAYEEAQNAVTFAEGVSAKDYVHALMQLARCASFIKGMQRGRELAEQAYHIMQAQTEAFSPYDRAKLLQMLGQICWWHGDAHMAIKYCRLALNLLNDADTPLGALLLITLSTPTLYQKDYDTALQLAEKAIDICQELQLKETLPAAYAALGNVLTRIGELEQAESALHTAINQADFIDGARYAQVMAAGYLAQNLALQGRVSEARQLAEHSLQPYEDQPIVYDVYVCRSVLADLLLDTHKLDEARTIYSNLISLGESTQYRIPLAMAYFGLAYILMQEEKPEQAIQYSQESLKLLEPAMMHQLYLDQHDRALVVCEALAQHMPDNEFVQQIYRMLSKIIPEPQQPIITITRSQRIEIKTLGSFQVSHNGTIIEPKAFASAKARDLLAYFVNVRSKSVTLDRVIDAIWSEGTGSTSGFHTALYRVRAALRQKGEKEKFILSEVGEYRLDSAKFDIDIDQFDNLLKRAKHAEQDKSIEFYEQALALYQGDYLDNLYYEWVVVERERLQRDYLTAIHNYSNFLLKDAQYHKASAWLYKALELEPYDEHLHIRYMQTLHQMGQQQNIIAHYHHLLDLLQEAFNAAPMTETQSAYKALLD